MVLATMAKHSSRLGLFFLFLSVHLPPARGLDIDLCGLARA
jgi:hypothetical protein